MAIPSDLEIANSATVLPLPQIAELAGIPTQHLELYGHGAAKVQLEAIVDGSNLRHQRWGCRGWI